MNKEENPDDYFYKKKPSNWIIPNQIPHTNPYDKWGKYVTDPQKMEKTKPVTIATLFPNLERWAIGFDPIFETLKELAAVKTAAYPPCNVSKFESGKYEILLAVAGFRREDISIFVEDRTLTVSSHTEPKLGEEDAVRTGELIHQGIAHRDFTRTFALGEYVEVADATLTDGMLHINLETHIPEEKMPKIIEIKGKN
jgi:molecular chaperone IbpA